MSSDPCARHTAAPDLGPADSTRVAGPPSAGLCVAYVPGVMPDKWFRRWEERVAEQVLLRQMPLEEDRGLQVLEEGEAHLALLRPDQEPEARDRQRFHAVRLYAEKQVVVLPKDHVLTLVDEVPLEELADEALVQNPGDAPGREAMELVAAGLGLLIAPMPMARLHHRRDLTYRVVPELPETEVLAVWPRAVGDPRPEQDETVIQEFIGILRGRRGESSRGALALSRSQPGSSCRDARAPSGTRQASQPRQGGRGAKTSASARRKPTRQNPRSRSRRPGR